MYFGGMTLYYYKTAEWFVTPYGQCHSTIRQREPALGYPIHIRQGGLSLKLSRRFDVSHP